MRLLDAEHGARQWIFGIAHAGVCQKEMAGLMRHQLQRVISAVGAQTDQIGRMDWELAQRPKIQHRLQPSRRAILLRIVDREIAVTRAMVPDGLFPRHRARSCRNVLVIEECDVIVGIVVTLVKLLGGDISVRNVHTVNYASLQALIELSPVEWDGNGAPSLDEV